MKKKDLDVKKQCYVFLLIMVFINPARLHSKRKGLEQP